MLTALACPSSLPDRRTVNYQDTDEVEGRLCCMGISPSTTGSHSNGLMSLEDALKMASLVLNLGKEEYERRLDTCSICMPPGFISRKIYIRQEQALVDDIAKKLKEIEGEHEYKYLVTKNCAKTGKDMPERFDATHNQKVFELSLELSQLKFNLIKIRELKPVNPLSFYRKFLRLFDALSFLKHELNVMRMHKKRKADSIEAKESQAQERQPQGSQGSLRDSHGSRVCSQASNFGRDSLDSESESEPGTPLRLDPETGAAAVREALEGSAEWSSRWREESEDDLPAQDESLRSPGPTPPLPLPSRPPA